MLAFCGVGLLLAMTPGPDMALVLRNTLRGGRAAGMRTAGGILVGLVGWGLATALGVAAVLAASATVFTILKIAGGIYLVYLGIQTLRSLRRGADRQLHSEQRRGSPLRQGLLTNLLNPKLSVLFTTLLPQFISESDPYVAKATLLAVLFAVIGLAWLTLYVSVVHVVARSRRFRTTVEAISGAVLVALGLRLVADR